LEGYKFEAEKSIPTMKVIFKPRFK